MSTRLLQRYFWYKATHTLIIGCNSSDSFSICQDPGGLGFFFAPQTDVPISATRSPSLAFYRKARRSLADVLWTMSSG